MSSATGETSGQLRIIAILQTFNERRFVATCIEHLNAQGVSVYLIDNDSTDDTLEIAERYLGRGVVGIERMPRLDSWDLWRQLERKQELAASLDADWFMHVDADELHTTHDPRKTLAEAFAEVDAQGFNAVNFLEFTFVPTAESPDHDHPDFVRTMQWYYPYGQKYPNRVNAWKRQEDPVELVTSDGHEVDFPGLRIAPRNLCMRHYMFLSVEHACEKWSRETTTEPVRAAHERAKGKGNWRIWFHPGMIELPSERKLRQVVPGRPLDRTEPVQHHLAIRMP